MPNLSQAELDALDAQREEAIRYAAHLQEQINQMQREADHALRVLNHGNIPRVRECLEQIRDGDTG